MTIKPGKYALRNGAKCEVLHVDTEHGLLYPVYAVYLADDEWKRTHLRLDGKYVENIDSIQDIVAEGWPIEFVVGRWYLTKAGNEYQLMANTPSWLNHATRIYVSKNTVIMFPDSHIACEIDTPDFAKEQV